MRTAYTALLLALIFLTSCQPDYFFNEHSDGFENNRWYADQPVKFEVLVPDDQSRFRLLLTMRHVYGFQHATFRVKMDIKTPSGRETSGTFDLIIKKADGTHLAKCSVDLCDLTQEVQDDFRFAEAGLHHFSFTNQMPFEFVPNVMDFGMRLEVLNEEKE